MLTDKEFLAFMGDESLDGSLEERLNKLIDDEMEKSEEEMDTELIEYCLNKLNYLDEKALSTPEKKGKGEPNKKHVRLRFKRLIAIAAIISVLLICTLTATGNTFGIKLFDGIVELYNDYVRINFDRVDGEAGEHKFLETELAKELADNGFDKVLLPEAIFSDEYEITKTEYEFTELAISANIFFKYKGNDGCIYITQHAMKEVLPSVEYPNVTGEIKKIDVNGINVYCFVQNNISSINYKNDLSLYTIQIPIELDDAIEFAKTIK